MMMGKSKKSKIHSPPPEKSKKGLTQTRLARRVLDGSDQFSWRFSDMDDWFMNDSGKEESLNWNIKDDSHVAKIVERMKGLEGLGWKKLINDRKNHHFVPVKNMSEKAYKRWNEIYWEKRRSDATSLFSLKIDSVKRLFGVKEGGVFIVIWYDPYHQICPSAKKNT